MTSVVPVPGKGVKPSPYMIVGEAWSQLGIKTQQPFTGAGEQLLAAVLREVGISGKKCYFANAVTTYVGDKVTKGHVDLHREALYAEVKEVQPKVILACGSWAIYALTGKTTPVAEIRGYPIWSVNLQAYVIPAYHPNTITFNPSLFEDFGRDVSKMKVAIEYPVGGIQYSEPVLHVIRNWKELESAKIVLENPDDMVMAVDIETGGFNCFADPILSIGVGPTENDVYVFTRAMCEDPEVQHFLIKLFERTDIEYVYQNGKFDIQFLKANPDPKIFNYKKMCVIPNARCDFDTMLAHYCIDERQGTHGLKTWAREEFDAPDWEADIAKYLPNKSTSYEAIPPEVLYKYQSYDVFYTRKGRYRFIERMKEEGTYECFKRVYTPAVSTFAELELEGIPIDRQRLQELYTEAQPRIAAAQEVLTKAAEEAGWNPTEYAKAKNKEKMAKWISENKHLLPERRSNKPGGTEIPLFFNPASHPQLAWVAYDLCNQLLFEGKKTCNKEAVDIYRHRHPFWLALANYKEVSGTFGTFIKGMLERTGPDDRIRPDFLLHGTRTGRISCTNPNMQNLPRGSVVKDFFIADSDSIVVNADYKTLEVVIAAILSNDSNMKKPFIEGLDFHSETANAIFNKEIPILKAAISARDRRQIDTFLERTLMLEVRAHVHELLDAEDFDEAYKVIWKRLRHLTKYVTFGIMYGRKAESLAKGELNCTVLEATSYIDAFFNRYPIYREWLRAQENSAIKNGFVQNVFGFKRRWAFITKDLLHEIRNQSWNTPVQGTASMVCMMALCRTQAVLKKQGWGRALFPVHDSIVYSIKKIHLQEALSYLHEEMTKDVIGTDAKLEVGFEIGPTYMQVKEVINIEGKWVFTHDGNE
ncbi:MAG: DNA polymerase I, thermostable [Syntrophomonadaceae bacterium]|nr:DNA polymerase I, thermostable [Bacillota bacterium]